MAEASWLSLTPETERELLPILAAMRADPLPGAAAERTAAERVQLERALGDRPPPNRERNGGA
jgi:hypothetical protein